MTEKPQTNPISAKGRISSGAAEGSEYVSIDPAIGTTMPPSAQEKRSSIALKAESVPLNSTRTSLQSNQPTSGVPSERHLSITLSNVSPDTISYLHLLSHFHRPVADWLANEWKLDVDMRGFKMGI